MYILPPWRLIETKAQAHAILPALMAQQEVAVDTETTGINRWKDVVDCWSLSFADPSERTGFNRYALHVDALYWLQDFFDNPDISKVFHNALFDLCMLANTGIDVEGTVICTLILDCLVDENRYGVHGLKECSWDYLGLKMRSFREVFGTTPLGDLPLEAKADYASEDAWATMLLLDKVLRPYAQEDILGKRAGRDYSVWDLYMHYFPDYIKVIFRMCRRGWRLNADYLNTLKPLLEAEIQRIDKIFNKYAYNYAIQTGCGLHDYTHISGRKHIKEKKRYPGGIINLSAREQLAHFFTVVLERPVIKLTHGGTSGNRTPSTDEEVMTAYAEEHNCTFAKLLLQRRELEKKLGTYVKGLQKWLDPQGKIHASLKIMGARTGRLSCTEPNLQNIPRPDNDSLGIRRAFIADPGHILIVADYKALEMRILASVSGCPVLTEVLNSGVDPHCTTAARVSEYMGTGYTYEELLWAKKNEHNFNMTAAERSRVEELVAARSNAKAVGFGIAYGRGKQSLAVDLSITEDMAQELIDLFYRIYPGVKSYVVNTIRWCKMRKPIPYVSTWLLRKRRVDSINSTDKKTAREGERQAINAPIQGTAADIAKVAMLTCDHDPVLAQLGCEMLMQVHDELIFQLPEENLEAGMKRVQECMEGPFAGHFAVPIEASVGYGYNWLDAK